EGRQMNRYSLKPILMGVVLLSAATPICSQDHEEAKVIEGARREGKIVWYTTMSTDHSKHFADRFQEKYPFVKPVVFRAGGGSLFNRILVEANAGQNEWDAMHG